MQNKIKLFLFLPEMSEDQRYPWNDSCGTNYEGKCHQGRVLDTIYKENVLSRQLGNKFRSYLLFML